MMMALGMFVFGLPTLAYQTLRRQSTYRHASNARMGAAPAYQFVGPGDDTITLSGWIAPEVSGSGGSLELLRRMAATGKAYMLVDGTGQVYGAYVIPDILEDQTEHNAFGMPRRIAFTVQLQRVDDARARTLLGDLEIPISAMDGSVANWGV